MALSRANAILVDVDDDDSVEVRSATNMVIEAEDALANMTLTPKNLLTGYKDLSAENIWSFNSYYSRCATDYVVESLHCILDTCDTTLQGKLREVLTGVPAMDHGDPLVFKMTLEVTMAVKESSLRSMTEQIKNVRMKDISGEHVGTIVIYLKGVILLLDNCNSLPTDVLGLLNDFMISADSQVFLEYMQSIYFSHKQKIKVITPREYVEFAEKEYITL